MRSEESDAVTVSDPMSRARAASRFVAQWADRFAGQDVLRAKQDSTPATVSATDRGELVAQLRIERNAAMARIAATSLTDIASVADTLEQLSALADSACQRATAWVRETLIERHGRPRDAGGAEAHAVILGMGKLGGRELNFSSDIDLIFLHTADGMTDGATPIENERFFIKLAQEVGKLLSERTPDGFVFRVDTMLRPFGSAGPMSMSVDAAEEYYQTHGREWERYAMIKARPIAGDIAAGEDFLRRLRPFVYRRYLDYNAINSLRDLKRRIHDDVVARKVIDDVKLGPGGIRELEFIVQSFQLVRGGQDASLRNPSLRPTLDYLGESGLLPRDTAQKLDASYVFLRKLENAIQMYEDQQTHRLPVDEDARYALCVGLDFASWGELRAHFDGVAAYVNAEFRRVFADPTQDAEDSDCAPLVRTAFGPEIKVSELKAALLDKSFVGADESLAQRLVDLAHSRLVRGLSEAAALSLHRSLGQLLDECLRTDEPTRTAERVLRVVQSVAGRSTYLTLLDQSAVVRAHLVRLCAASQWVTEQIAASPAVLDALLDQRTLYAPPGREAMTTELAARFSGVPVQDVETGMDLLRRYRNEVTVRIAAADISGSLPLVKVSDHLTWLAEAVLSAAMERATLELKESHGLVVREDGSVAGLGAIAYGKFGGIELGYGSDLDLVFVHEDVPGDAETSGGTRSIAAAAWFARLTQRVIHWLSTLTPAGRAYEVDLELRPSGQSGPVVVSLKSFSAYQRDKAWTWEHQALTRARYVAGPVALGEQVEALRREVLGRRREPKKLAKEIVEMRRKMRGHLEKRRPGAWDVKQGEGGVIDSEFLTQYLVLRDAADRPELLEWSDNWRQLDALAAAGSLPAEDRSDLIAGYRAYRAFAHARALQSEEALAPEERFASERAHVRAAWKRQFAEAEESKD
jgi:glutamate-ammonia-ligase adenylyltransferase